MALEEEEVVGKGKKENSSERQGTKKIEREREREIDR